MPAMPAQVGQPDERDEEEALRNAPFIRAENEDDDGYDPWSDRLAPREPLFEEDPWA